MSESVCYLAPSQSVNQSVCWSGSQSFIQLVCQSSCQKLKLPYLYSENNNLIITTYMSIICSQMSLTVVANQTTDGDSSLAAFRSLRTLRALRPLRAISRWEGMKVMDFGH